MCSSGLRWDSQAGLRRLLGRRRARNESQSLGRYRSRSLVDRGRRVSGRRGRCRNAVPEILDADHRVERRGRFARRFASALFQPDRKRRDVGRSKRARRERERSGSRQDGLNYEHPPDHGANQRRDPSEAVNWLRNWSVTINLSNLFRKPAPPTTVSKPESPAIAQMNADVEKRIEEP